MMNHYIDPARIGLALGALTGGVHLLWSLLVLIGLAQPLINMILWAHMVSIPVAVNTFDFSTAVTLIIITGAVGYAVGYLFGLIWNWMHREPVLTPPQQ